MVRGLQAGITQRQSPVHDVQGTRYPVGFGGVARRRVVSSPSAPMVRGLQAGITQRQSPVCRALAMGHVCRLPHNNQTIKGSPLPTPRPNTMGPLRTRGAERCSVAINVGEADHIEVPIIITNNNVTSNASQNSLLHLEEDRKKAQARNLDPEL